jgi:large subunit ribosomal protein L22
LRFEQPQTSNLKHQTNKMEAVAKLRDYPTSPRKMRLLADEIRGMSVEKALALLEHHPQHSAKPLHKLLWSAVKNWEQKNEGQSAADNPLVVTTVFVDGARVLKRMRPAPQGRGYRVRKRSNHVTIAVNTKAEQGTKSKVKEAKAEGTTEAQAEAPKAKKTSKKATSK